MSLSELQQLERTSVMGSYARLPVEFARGEGARLWDGQGNEYLDFLCGISVTNLGHCHPHVVEAVREQVGRLMHVSNLFYTEPAMRLAARLSQASLGGKVFFCNSGAEANEAAIKLARKATHAGDIVVAHGAFHGRTYGALSATPQETKQAPFAPLVPGFRAVAPEPGALAGAVDERTAAVILEPIQGESGVHPPLRGAARGGARGLRRAWCGAHLRRGPDAAWAARDPCGPTSRPAWCPTPSRSRRLSPEGCPSARWSPARALPTCSSPATTPRPSVAARSWRRRRSPRWR